MGWANRITLGRAVLTLVLWALLAWTAQAPAPWMWWTSLGIFTLAAASDFVDGMLARSLGEVTTFGRIADPLVDKMLTIGTFILLLGVAELHQWLPAWTVALMLTREILITTVRASAEGKGLNFQAIWWGKYKMIVQCVAIGALMMCMLRIPLAHAEIEFLAWLPGEAGTWNLAHVLVWLATLLTVGSGFIYVQRALRLMRNAG